MYCKKIIKTIWRQIINALFPPIPCVWGFSHHINGGFAYYNTDCGNKWAIDVVKPLNIKFCPICGRPAVIDIDGK